VHWPYDPPALNQIDAILPGMMWVFVLHLHAPGGLIATYLPFLACFVGLAYSYLHQRFKPESATEFAELLARINDRPWTFLESEQALNCLTEATERSLGGLSGSLGDTPVAALEFKPRASSPTSPTAHQEMVAELAANADSWRGNAASPVAAAPVVVAWESESKKTPSPVVGVVPQPITDS